MDKLARDAARRILGQEAPECVRDLLEQDGLPVPDGPITGLDAVRIRLDAMAASSPEAARMAQRLKDGVLDE